MNERKRERHGMSRTPTYHSWAMMKQRCTNEQHTAFDRYGERSIKVCQRWADSFVAFFEDMGEKPEGMTLDRIDNDGDYCPENCRWATPKEQANNTRRTRYVIVDGKKMLATVVAAMNGISRSAITKRIDKGWTLEQAVGLEEHVPDSAIEIDGDAMTMAQWAKKLGISRQAVDQRIKNGWNMQEALTMPKVDFSQRRGVPTGPVAKKRNNPLGEFLTQRRQRLALTQSQVAERAGLATATISLIETGKSAVPSMRVISQLAYALDCQIEEIAQLVSVYGIDTIQYKWYDEWEKGGMQMSNDERERATWLQVRMSEDEKALLSTLSEEYGLSISAFVRMMIAHFDEKRPTVSVRFGPKVDASVTEMAGIV